MEDKTRDKYNTEETIRRSELWRHADARNRFGN